MAKKKTTRKKTAVRKKTRPAIKKAARKRSSAGAKKRSVSVQKARRKKVQKKPKKKSITRHGKKTKEQPKTTQHISKKKEPAKKVRKKKETSEEGSMALGLTPMRIYLNQIEHIPLLTPEEEIELSRKIQHKTAGWKEARERMIKGNLRLVINIAKRYANMGLTFSDLVEEGNIGLMRAVGKFNYKKGYRFSTYASWWIKQGMMRALSNQAKLIRIPVHMYESITKWRKARELHIQRFGKIPTQKELAKQMDVDVGKIREIESVLNNPGSLNAPLSLDGASEMIDIIEDSNASMPSETSHELSRSERVQEMLNHVNDRERRILILRFGLYGEEPRTLEHIAQEFGVTRERVRQIEEAALKKLRTQAQSDSNALHDFI